MPTRVETIETAISLFQSARYPSDSGLTPETAWLGIYQTLLWYEEVNWVGYDALPHIIDADKLRPRNPAQKKQWKQPTVWQHRAALVERYVAEALEVPRSEVRGLVDLLLRHPDFEGFQRQNPLGTAFVGLISHILRLFGSTHLSYETEQDATRWFTGIQMPGRSSTPYIDVLALKNNTPCAVVSAKWSIRHDRLSDFTNECPIYKTAFNRIYRASGVDLRYFVVTNEFDPGRLTKILTDTCIDGVVHVHKPAITRVCELDDRMENLLDMSGFLHLTQDW